MLWELELQRYCSTAEADSRLYRGPAQAVFNKSIGFVVVSHCSTCQT